MGDRQAMMQEFETVLKSGDFGALTGLIQNYATDDFVEEWPQSGERLTREASLKLAEHYPEMSGTSPRISEK